ncbi:MAG TPA: PQQ-binding-like beta-propeller repeat protein [Melioribacteraceae bacterium]|nr:PQQ-binding-like beta-propeller repeat protein [Melioribacteraceae bacterium]
MKLKIFISFLFLYIVFPAADIPAQSSEGYTLIWNADHGYHMFDVCFSPDGKKILAIEGTVSANSVKLFDALSGQLIWSKNAAAEFGRFSPDMSKVYIGGASTLALNISDGSQIWINNQPADCLDLNNQGTHIVVGKETDRVNGKVVMIRTSDGSKVWEGTTKGPVNSIKFSYDGSKVISGGGDLSDREAILWSSINGTKIWTHLSGPIIYTVNFSPDGNSIIVGTDWQVITMLNAASGSVGWTHTLIERFLDSGFTPDSKKVFLSSNNSYIRVFDVTTGALQWDKVINGSNSHNVIRSSPDGTRLATGSSDKYLNVFDMADGTTLFRGLHNSQVNRLNYSYDGTRIVTGTFYGGKVSVWQKDGTVHVNEFPSTLPDTYQLFQNYPNPFNPATVISYQIPSYAFVRLRVYDILGNEVAALVDKEQHAGFYSVTFNAKNLTSGIYFYRLEAGSFSEAKKLILVK